MTKDFAYRYGNAWQDSNPHRGRQYRKGRRRGKIEKINKLLFVKKMCTYGDRREGRAPGEWVDPALTNRGRHATNGNTCSPQVLNMKGN